MRYARQTLPAYCTCGAKGWLKCPECVATEKRRVAQNCSQPGGKEESPALPCKVEERVPARLPIYAVKGLGMHRLQEPLT
jgi:hypothetical protein